MAELWLEYRKIEKGSFVAGLRVSIRAKTEQNNIFGRALVRKKVKIDKRELHPFYLGFG